MIINPKNIFFFLSLFLFHISGNAVKKKSSKETCRLTHINATTSLRTREFPIFFLQHTTLQMPPEGDSASTLLQQQEDQTTTSERRTRGTPARALRNSSERPRTPTARPQDTRGETSGVPSSGTLAQLHRKWRR